MPVETRSGELIRVPIKNLTTLSQMGHVIPPTEAGWRQVLEKAPHSDVKFMELVEMARWWWRRNVPHNLYASARKVA